MDAALDRALLFGPELREDHLVTDPRDFVPLEEEEEEEEEGLPSWDELSPYLDQLDARDREILQLTRRGLSQEAIGRAVGVSQMGASYSYRRSICRLRHLHRLDQLPSSDDIRDELAQYLTEPQIKVFAAFRDHGVLSRAAASLGLSECALRYHWHAARTIVSELAEQDRTFEPYRELIDYLDCTRIPARKSEGHQRRFGGELSPTSLSEPDRDLLRELMAESDAATLAVEIGLDDHIALYTAALGSELGPGDALLIERFLASRRQTEAEELIEHARSGFCFSVPMARSQTEWITLSLDRASRIVGELTGRVRDRLRAEIQTLRRELRRVAP